ncbi:MAG: response regulator [Oligoflexia bacterium]|nr:response regulator [Oligoflexia bacterium]
MTTENKNKQRKILLVEDDQDIKELCRIAIYSTPFDITVIETANAHDAYRMARNQKFDLIWTDQQMPKVLGTDFILAIRELPNHRNVPVLVFSGYVEEAKRKCGNKSGVYFVSKEDGTDKAIEILVKILSGEKKKSNVDCKKISKELLTYFISSTRYVISSMCAVDSIVADNIEVENTFKNPKTKVDIISLMPIKSTTIDAYFFLGFPEKTFLEIVERLLGEKHKKIKIEFTDACAELANIIFGHVKTRIENKYEFEKTLPQLLMGEDIYLPDKNMLIISVNFKSSVGDFLIGISPVDKL